LKLKNERKKKVKIFTVNNPNEIEGKSQIFKISGQGAVVSTLRFYFGDARLLLDPVAGLVYMLVLLLSLQNFALR
jgi:hypothetical protein